jgi:hypothetical protein
MESISSSRLRTALMALGPPGFRLRHSAACAAALLLSAFSGQAADRHRGDTLDGPGGIYARIPVRDEFGRDQLAMFRAWNPDPIGTDENNLEALNPRLAAVVRKVRADNPELRLVIGSGRRDGRLQRLAFDWGWSRTRSSAHQAGNAVDLWPLDREGRVHFDAAAQNRIGAAMKKAAGDLGIRLLWGGYFQGFKSRDRSHFELASP